TARLIVVLRQAERELVARRPAAERLRAGAGDEAVRAAVARGRAVVGVEVEGVQREQAGVHHARVAARAAERRTLDADAGAEDGRAVALGARETAGLAEGDAVDRLAQVDQLGRVPVVRR